MLKVKKIMEEVLPQAPLVTPEEAKEAAVKNAAKPIIFEGCRNDSHVRCMACDSVFSIATMKEIECPKCGNKALRRAEGYMQKDTALRTIQAKGEFVLVSEEHFSYRETVDNGLTAVLTSVYALVFQKDDVGLFQAEVIHDGQEPRLRWTRSKKTSAYYLPNRCQVRCRPYLLPNTEGLLIDRVAGEIEKEPLSTMFNKLKEKAREDVPQTVECPEFDESLINYDIENASVLHQIYSEVEYKGHASPIVKQHIWCTKCGKYSVRAVSRETQSVYECPNCKEHFYRSDSTTNFFVTPQEFEDGTMLLRIDDAKRIAFVLEKKVGEDLDVKYQMQVGLTQYVYLTLDGKAHLYGANREPIKQLVLPSPRYGQTNQFVCRQETIERILNNTAVKRTGFVEFFEKIGKTELSYFNVMAICPYTEMFSKMGLTSIVEDIIKTTDQSKIPTYLKKADKDSAFMRLTKPQMKELIEENCRLDDFERYIQVFKKDAGAMFSDYLWVGRRSHPRHILDILRVGVPSMTVKKIREYLERVDDAQCCSPAESAQLWSDYLRMLKNLDCDLTDHALIYPNSLKREHNKASRKISQVRNERLTRAFRERSEKNKWCEWENDEFKVIVPSEITELYEEGRKLFHCVGSYGSAVVKGDCVISFIRRKTDAETPFCTVEIRGKQIVQARGLANRAATGIPKVKSFMEKWAKERGLTLCVA